MGGREERNKQKKEMKTFAHISLLVTHIHMTTFNYY